MYRIQNFTNNDDVRIVDSKGAFQVIEYKRDLSVTPQTAMTAYFCNVMNIRKRQLMCDVTSSNIICQAGAMQWMVGSVAATSGIKGVGDLLGKTFRGKVTGETIIKPEYTGNGVMVLEPTYKHIILLDTREWNGSVVLDDGLFLACEAKLKQKTARRTSISSAMAGGEGWFNLCLTGEGVVAIEAKCPREELIEVMLEDDVLKVDGSFAIAWSNSLEFTVERSGKSLIGSAVSKEGLVNVYRGTGRVLLAPVDDVPADRLPPEAPEEEEGKKK